MSSFMMIFGESLSERKGCWFLKGLMISFFYLEILSTRMSLKNNQFSCVKCPVYKC